MIINRNKKKPRGQFVRMILAIAIFSGLMSLALPAHAQVQRKPKGPQPPSYDEVMQRALNEKKAASNAPAVAPVTRSVPAVVTPQPTAVTPATELKSAGPPAVQVAAPSVPAVEIAPKSLAPVTVAPVPASVAPPPTETAVRPPLQSPVATPAVVKVESPAPSSPPPRSTTAKDKGPKFSELPPDLRPGVVPGQTATPVAPAAIPAGAKAFDSSTNAMDSLDDKYRLAIGDRLSFRIVEDLDEPKSLSVTDSGELELPYIGRYPARGKTCKELAFAVKARLEKEYYRHATVVVAVDLMTKSRGKIYVYGAVRAPGPQDIPSDEEFTLGKAIMRAGGFTDFANKRNVKVTRKGAGPGDQTFTVDVEKVLEKGHPEADLRLESGDLIYVDERTIRF